MAKKRRTELDVDPALELEPEPELEQEAEPTQEAPEPRSAKEEPSKPAKSPKRKINKIKLAMVVAGVLVL